MSFSFSFRSVNLIGMAVHQVCLAWTNLFARIGTQALSARVLLFLRYNDKRVFFQLVSKEEGFASLVLRLPLTPYICLTMSARGVDEKAAVRTEEIEHNLVTLI